MGLTNKRVNTVVGMQLSATTDSSQRPVAPCFPLSFLPLISSSVNCSLMSACLCFILKPAKLSLMQDDNLDKVSMHPWFRGKGRDALICRLDVISGFLWLGLRLEYTVLAVKWPAYFR